MKVDKNLLTFAGICLVVTLVFATWLFGMTGARMVLALVVVSAVFYYILSNFSFSQGELTVFSLLLAVTVYPSLVYLLGLVLPWSFALIAVLVLLVAVGFGIRKLGSRKSKQTSSHE